MLQRYYGNQHPLARFQSDFNNMMSRFFDDPFFQQSNASLMPPINIKEEANRYVVEAELPGMDIDDIDIQVFGNSITLRGERKVEEKQEKEHFHMVESRYGSFHRSFTLPEHINPQDVTAEHKNGILYIYVPKNEANRPRKIEIKRQNH